MGFLQGFREDPQLIDIGELAVVSQGFLGPSSGHDLHSFYETFPTFLHVNAEAFEFLALVAATDTEV